MEYDEYGVLMVGKVRLNQMRAQEKRRQLTMRETRAGFAPIRPQIIELPADLPIGIRYF